MDAATFVTQFRAETRDDADPPLWSDAAIVSYLDEAQKQFCDKTIGIADSVSAVCKVALPADGEVVNLSPKIKAIRRATLVERQREMCLISVEDARVDGIFMGGPKGEPRHLITGVGGSKAQIAPIPNADYNLHLDVYRFPLADIESVGDDIEVDELFVPILMHYVLFRAYARQDADTIDLRRSQEHLVAFTMGCEAANLTLASRRTKQRIINSSW